MDQMKEDGPFHPDGAHDHDGSANGPNISSTVSTLAASDFRKLHESGKLQRNVGRYGVARQ
jgi:hypothetical protein